MMRNTTFKKGRDMKRRKYYSAIIAVVLCAVMILPFAAFGAAASEEAETLISSDTSVDAVGKKIYFAAPLFSESEREYNLKITEILESYGYEVFLPQRDGLLATELEGKTEEEKTQMIFEKDVEHVLDADILFIMLDGRVPDEGACVELGMAYANNKRCYGFKTDARAAEIDMDLNPMIAGCFIKLFENYDGEKLIEELKQYLSGNEL